jgi:hypothetical protein
LCEEKPLIGGIKSHVDSKTIMSLLELLLGLAGGTPGASGISKLSGTL